MTDIPESHVFRVTFSSPDGGRHYGVVFHRCCCTGHAAMHAVALACEGFAALTSLETGLVDADVKVADLNPPDGYMDRLLDERGVAEAEALGAGGGWA